MADIPPIRALRSRTAVARVPETTSVLSAKGTLRLETKRTTRKQSVGVFQTNVRNLSAEMETLTPFSKPYTEPSTDTTIPTVQQPSLFSDSYEEVSVVQHVYNKAVLLSKIRSTAVAFQGTW